MHNDYSSTKCKTLFEESTISLPKTINYTMSLIQCICVFRPQCQVWQLLSSRSIITMIFNEMSLYFPLKNTQHHCFPHRQQHLIYVISLQKTARWALCLYEQAAHGQCRSAGSTLPINTEQTRSEWPRFWFVIKGLWMQDYKSLCTAVMICATMVNTHTHTYRFLFEMHR